MNTRRTTLLVAVLLAIGTGWLTLNYINGLQRQSAASNEQRTILVATSDIAARTTITPQMFRQVTRPANSVEPDAITDPNLTSGALALISIPAGGTLTASKVGHPADLALPVRLSAGKRAVSVLIDKVKGVSGLVQPGDRVDVISVLPRTGDETPTAVTILRGIRVLAIGTSLENSSATPSPQEQSSTTVTLEVSPQQADLLAMADVNTNLRLALRSPKEPINSEPTEALHFPVNTVVAQSAPAPAPVAAVAAAPAPPQPQQHPADPPRRQSGLIMIIDGDHVGYSTSSGQPAQQ